MLEEARASDIINDYEAEMLSHIIPCCRKDKSKRDFIESLLARQDIDESLIRKIEDDINFDPEPAPATAAKLKDYS